MDEANAQIEQAVAQGTGLLITDHYHRHVTPLTDDAYVLWQKQCYRLDGDASIHDQLVETGHLRDDASARS